MRLASIEFFNIAVDFGPPNIALPPGVPVVRAGIHMLTSGNDHITTPAGDRIIMDLSITPFTDRYIKPD